MDGIWAAICVSTWNQIAAALASLIVEDDNVVRFPTSAR